jgi:tripartite-type tricarboxylate transporter receptor subunit TctC
MKLLEHRANIRFLFVPFPGAGPAANALLGRDVDVMYDTLGGIAGLLESGDVRLLASTAKERLARYPDVPTAREQGFDVEFDYASGFVAPRGMMPELADLITDRLKRSFDDPEHATLLARVHLTPWWRGRAAYEEYVATMLREQPPLLRAMGVIR